MPTAVLVESLTGNGARDALTNRVVGQSLVSPLEEPLACRAAQLRTTARAGPAVDAVVVATAELFETLVITGDHQDLGRLSEHADGVALLPVI